MYGSSLISFTRWYNVPLDKLREKAQEIRNYEYSYEGYRPIIHPKLLEIIEMETFKK